MNYDAKRIKEARARCEAATEGPWRAGRMDGLSYDAVGNGPESGPYKNVYVDDPDGTIHLGERLPATVARGYDALAQDCRDNATFIANACSDLPDALDDIEALQAENERLRQQARMALTLFRKKGTRWRLCAVVQVRNRLRSIAGTAQEKPDG